MNKKVYLWLEIISFVFLLIFIVIGMNSKRNELNKKSDVLIEIKNKKQTMQTNK